MVQTRDVNAGGNATLVAGNLIQNIGADSAPRALHQLPPPVNLVGRETELAELEYALTSGENTGATIAGAVGLQGMGGVGKTALAVALAHRLKDRYPDAQLVFNLHGVDPSPTKSDAIMERVIQSFHPTVRLPDDSEQLAALYRSVLADAGRVLLLLDNAANAEQIEPLIPPSNCLLLVTSRTHFHLPGLACRSLDCLAPEKSRELLLLLAPGLGEHAADAAELCGHLPLALRVVAGLIQEQSTYRALDLVGVLRRGEKKLGKVDAAFSLSYDLLPSNLQAEWARLSVFTASFDAFATAAIFASKLEDANHETARVDLQQLVNASLVEWHELTERYRLHDLARHFARTKLSIKEASTAHMRHAAYFCIVAESVNQLYIKGHTNTVRGLALFDRERAHIEAAFAWLTEQPGSESARLLVRLVSAIANLASLRFHPRVQILWSDSGRLAAQRTGDRRGEGNAVGGLGNAYAVMGEQRKAIKFYEQSLKIAREIGDRRGEGNTLGNLGLAYAGLGEVRKAIEFYEQALKIDRDLNNRVGEGITLNNLGNLYGALGEFDQDIEFQEQSLNIVRAIGDKQGEGETLGSLGYVYAALKKTDKAIEFSQQHLEIAREIGDRRGEARALANMAIVYALSKNLQKTIEYNEKVLTIYREIGDRRGEAHALENFGNAYAELGESLKAVDFYEQGLRVARDIGHRRGEGNALYNSALVLYGLGRHAVAMTRAEQALQIYTETENPTAKEVRQTLAGWHRAKTLPAP